MAPLLLKSILVHSFMFFSFYMSIFPLANLVVQKKCNPDGPPADINMFICSDMTLVNEADDIVSMRAIIRSVSSAISSVMFGLWRDKTGMNIPLILIGEISEAIGALVFLMISFFWSSDPYVPVIIESLIGGLFGFSIYIMGMDCYVIVNSEPENRSSRLQFLIVGAISGVLLGEAAGGIAVSSLGYVWTYLIALCLHTITIVLILLLIKEDARKKVSKGLSMRLKGIFKSRPNNAVLWMMLFLGFFMIIIYIGEAIHTTYYLQKRFHLTVREIAIYSVFSSTVPMIGSMVFPTLIIRVLKWSDLTLGIMAAGWTGITSLIRPLARTVTELYLSKLLDIMRFINDSVPQSVISKCVETNELGLYLGLVSTVGVAFPYIINKIYNYVFKSTNETMPGAYIFVTAAGCFIAMALFSLSYCLYKEPTQKVDDGSENNVDSGKVNHKVPETLDQVFTYK